MINCPNCNHHNPDGATQCEACYTNLPLSTTCPNCGASVQSDATFCGQCGFNLQLQNTGNFNSIPETVVSQPDIGKVTLPNAPETNIPLPATVYSAAKEKSEPAIEENELNPAVVASNGNGNGNISVPSVNVSVQSEPIISPSTTPIVTPAPIPAEAVAPTPIIEEQQVETPAAKINPAATQLQTLTASLFHVQTNTKIELPQNLTVIHIGKTNNQIPPDIDVSGFPNSEIVSRVHADVRLEIDSYYIEDVGSSNGTYVNHTPLLVGNRHLLRPGDRIALGKGDKMTFIFQLT